MSQLVPDRYFQYNTCHKISAQRNFQVDYIINKPMTIKEIKLQNTQCYCVQNGRQECFGYH